MVGKNSRKKGGDTECLEKLQEQHSKLMESFRSLLSVEVSFLFPTMAGIQHLNKLNEIGQAVLLVGFLVMGYIGTVALLLSHSTNAMRWSAVVSFMTLVVTGFWLAIFHVTIALLTPESYMNASVVVNIVLFICIALLVGSQWKGFFRPPKFPQQISKSGQCVHHQISQCGEKTPNENSKKKDGDTKHIEKLQEQHNKLMESFRSLLSSEVSFLFPSMIGISHLDKLGEEVHAAVLAGFLLMGYLGTSALILSHSTDAMRWSALVSFMTEIVTIFCLGIFPITFNLLSPKAYRRACALVNYFLFVGGVLVIRYLWLKIFQRPKS